MQHPYQIKKHKKVIDQFEITKTNSIVRLVYDGFGDYGVSKDNDVFWGYSLEGARKTFENIRKSYIKEHN